MTIEEKNRKKEERKKLKCKQAYDELKNSLELDGYDQEVKLHKLVDKACEVQKQICETSDELKAMASNIANLNNPNEGSEYDEEEDASKEFKEFVRLAYMESHGKGISDKYKEKYNKKLEKSQRSTNLKNAFFTGLTSNGEFNVAENNDNNNSIGNPTSFTCEDFTETIKEAVNIKETLIKELRPQYNKLKMAAMYVTDFKLTQQEFKKIVDFHYYIEGGWPNPQTPPKLWNMINQFNNARKLLTNWGFPLWKNVLDNFDFDTSYKEVKPNEYNWDGDTDDDKE